jgi:4-hydroxybenzoate polyprenyltransferase
MASPGRRDAATWRRIDPGMVAGRVAAMRAHTDIVATGWVARLPVAWLPYLLLARVDRPIGAWLLFLPGLWGILLAGAPVWESVRLALLFGVGSLVMRAAGCVVNDLWDRDIDRMVARTAARPLASGMLRPRQALVFLAVLLAVGLVVLLQLDRLAQVLGVASLLLVAVYPLAKRVTWWPQLVMGFTFGFGAPLGYAAGAGRLDLAWAVLYGAAVLWDLGFDTVYAHQDREDDALVGVKSTARLFGERTAPFLAVCYGGTVVMLAVAGWLVGLGGWFFVALVLPAVLLGRQVWALDIDDPGVCLRLFRANREVGLAVAAAILIGWL